jgi:hypothetical protein
MRPGFLWRLPEIQELQGHLRLLAEWEREELELAMQ